MLTKRSLSTVGLKSIPTSWIGEISAGSSGAPTWRVSPLTGSTSSMRPLLVNAHSSPDAGRMSSPATDSPASRPVSGDLAVSVPGEAVSKRTSSGAVPDVTPIAVSLASAPEDHAHTSRAVSAVRRRRFTLMAPSVPQIAVRVGLVF